jgi:hypothetical protein
VHFKALLPSLPAEMFNYISSFAGSDSISLKVNDLRLTCATAE